MTTLTLADKRDRILAHEEAMARRLARRVLDKPVPPVWMILIPVFFVFYAWKIKQYSNGLKKFADDYLIGRRQALDAAFERARSDATEAPDGWSDTASAIPAEARLQHTELMALLVDHYRSLLSVSGCDRQAMVKAHYRNKTNYLLYCNQLNKAENAYNLALFPRIEGDRQDIRYVIDKMEQAMAELRRAEADEVFS